MVQVHQRAPVNTHKPILRQPLFQFLQAALRQKSSFLRMNFHDRPIKQSVGNVKWVY